jgi:hypothetical protein
MTITFSILSSGSRWCRLLCLVYKLGLTASCSRVQKSHGEGSTHRPSFPCRSSGAKAKPFFNVAVSRNPPPRRRTIQLSSNPRRKTQRGGKPKVVVAMTAFGSEPTHSLTHYLHFPLEHDRQVHTSKDKVCILEQGPPSRGPHSLPGQHPQLAFRDIMSLTKLMLAGFHSRPELENNCT